MTESVFYEVVGLLALAVGAGVVAAWLRQPLIIAFIAVGILAGPAALGWTTARDEIELLAELGIAILLFLVGLKLDFGLVRNLGLVAVATGVGQMGFTFLFGYLISVALGVEATTAVYVGIGLAFSSTIIVVKLISDKREIDSLHGRIAVGILIVQDIAVVLAMAALGTLEIGGDGGYRVGILLAGAAGAALVLGFLMRYVLPRLLRGLARSQELLVIFAVTWGVMLAAVGDFLGFSREIGAFLAGFSLASTGYREAIGAKLASLRDFLLLFFFVDLGARLEFEAVDEVLIQAAALSVFVLLGKPLIIMSIMGFLGYRRRTGFLSGVTLAQISEFSLIFVGLAVTLERVPSAAMGLVTIVGLATITVSTYGILHSHRLYMRFDRRLRPFERKDPARERHYEEQWAKQSDVEVIVFGLGRLGRPLVRQLRRAGRKVLGVDFDPELVRECGDEELEVVFGDAGDPDFLAQLGTGGARWVVSTLRDWDVNVVLLQTLRREGYRGRVAVTAHREEEAVHLRSLGAQEVWIPYRDAADAAALRIGGESETGAASHGES